MGNVLIITEEGFILDKKWTEWIHEHIYYFRLTDKACVPVRSNHALCTVSNWKEWMVGGREGLGMCTLPWSPLDSHDHGSSKRDVLPLVMDEEGITYLPWNATPKSSKYFPNRDAEKRPWYKRPERMCYAPTTQIKSFSSAGFSLILLTQEIKWSPSGEGLRESSRWNKKGNGLNNWKWGMISKQTKQKLLQNKISRGMLINHLSLITGGFVI